MLGQVCCDSNGKLNAQSVLLEASQEHGARQVPVDISELKDYSLFPGQVRKTYTCITDFYRTRLFRLHKMNVNRHMSGLQTRGNISLLC